MGVILNEYHTSLIQIRLSKVFKTDVGEVNVLEDIDLDIMKGEIFELSA